MATPRLAFAALVASSVLWGSGFLFAKISLRELSVEATVVYRFLIGSAVLMIPVIARKEWLRARDIPLVVAAGIAGVPLTYLLQFAGLARTSVSTVALLVGVLPVFLALGAVAFRRERPALTTWAAIIVSVAGVILIGGWAPRGEEAGHALVLASLMAVTVWTLLSKSLLASYSAIAVTGWVLTAGTVVLAVITLARGVPLPLSMSPAVWLAVIAGGLLCTGAAYLLWNFGLQHATVSNAGVFANIEVSTGVLLGVLFLGDRPGALALIGGALTLAAAAVVSAGRGPEREAERCAAATADSQASR